MLCRNCNQPVWSKAKGEAERELHAALYPYSLCVCTHLWVSAKMTEASLVELLTCCWVCFGYNIKVFVLIEGYSNAIEVFILPECFPTKDKCREIKKKNEGYSDLYN